MIVLFKFLLKDTARGRIAEFHYLMELSHIECPYGMGSAQIDQDVAHLSIVDHIRLRHKMIAPQGYFHEVMLCGVLPYIMEWRAVYAIERSAVFPYRPCRQIAKHSSVDIYSAIDLNRFEHYGNRA